MVRNITYPGNLKCWVNDNNEVHRADGPAIIHPDGREVWAVKGWDLHDDEVFIAKGILDGSLFNQIPIFINHERLKYFCQHVLQRGSSGS